MNQQFQASLTEEQKNKVLFQMTELALSESANLISSLGHSQLQFSVDTVGVEQKENIDRVFNVNRPDMVAVCHRIVGVCSGNLILLLEQSQALVLTKKILNDTTQLKEMSEMEEESLTEIGNIIVNNLLSHYVQILNIKVSTLIPVLNSGQYSQLIDKLSSKDENEYYMVKFTISIGKQNFTAYILWLDYLCQLNTTRSESYDVSNT